jgi:hypothetical protein
MAKRRCTAKTKAGGQCKAAPLKGKKRCMAHQPRKDRDARGFGGPQEGSGRPPKPRTVDIMRELVEENAMAALKPYWATLGYEVKQRKDGSFYLEESGDGGAKMTASYEGTVYVSTTDDLRDQREAAEKIFDRAYGKPAQAVELSGKKGDPIELAHAFEDPDVRKTLHELKRSVADARGRGPGRPSAGD